MATEAQKYIRRIRNTEKRQYASDYLAAMCANAERPERPYNLSVMAAQGVRLTLAGMYPNLYCTDPIDYAEQHVDDGMPDDLDQETNVPSLAECERRLAAHEQKQSDEQPTCPVCGGDAVLLGEMGNMLWMRCRNCGIDFRA